MDCYGCDGKNQNFLFLSYFLTRLLPALVIYCRGFPRSPTQSNLLFQLSITTITFITSNTFTHHLIHHLTGINPSHTPFYLCNICSANKLLNKISRRSIPMPSVPMCYLKSKDYSQGKIIQLGSTSYLRVTT